MDESILTTKLYIPPLRKNIIPRTNLLNKLDEGLLPGRRLILVSAPAGFGKTSLLGEWIEHCKHNDRIPNYLAHQSDPQSNLGDSGDHFCWITLDESDNDPVRFLKYLIAAFQSLNPDIGNAASSVFQVPLNPDKGSLLEAGLTLLINDLSSALKSTILILDDYQFITSQSVHEAIAFLLYHLPPVMRVVIASRTDPPIKLARMRARGQLCEVGAADLRFSSEETASFLEKQIGIRLSNEQISALEARTEGWIAGLQMVALSVQDYSDASAFISAFTGSNRFIQDYLIEEVYRHQPEPIQSFMLKTSLLKRMSGSLCNALTGRDDGQEMLEGLDQSNLFVVPLDRERIWFRYHSLFAEFLRNQLNRSIVSPRSQPAGISTAGIVELHDLASCWFEEQGLITEAVEHALQAKNYNRAANLIETNAHKNITPGEVGSLLVWFEKMPDSLICSRPRLCLIYSWSLLVSGRIDEAEARVSSVIQVTSTDNLEILGEAEAILTMITTLKNELPESFELANRALEHLPADNLFLRGLVICDLGMAYEDRGEIAAAAQAYSEAYKIGQKINHELLKLTAAIQLADLQLAQGKLHEAEAIYFQAMQDTAESGKILPAAGLAYLRMGWLLYEWNNLDAASKYLKTCIELGLLWESADISSTGLVYQAMIAQARGNISESRELITRAEKALQGKMVSPLTIVVAKACLARVWIRQGDSASLNLWMQDNGLHSANVPDFIKETDGAAWARALIYQQKPQLAVDCLDELIPKAEASGRFGNLIELLVVKALAMQAHGQSSEALSLLGQALSLALPQGYARLFVDEGKQMAYLLSKIQGDSLTTQYARKLIKAIDHPEFESGTMLNYPTFSQPDGPIVEPLSEREIEVLRLIASGLSNQQIAGQLVVAVSTVKTHINNIYGKLGVQNRVQALTRARELNFI